MVLSLERTTNTGRNNISQFLLGDFKIGRQSLIHFYFGCILSHRTKALKKKKKDPLKKQREEESQQQEASIPPSAGTGLGRFVREHGSHNLPLHSLCGVCQPRCRAGGHHSMWKGRQFCWLPLAPQAKVQAEVGLAGFLSSCQPTALQGHCQENASQIPQKSPPSHSLPCRGLD